MLSTDEFKTFSKKVVPYLSMMTHIEGRKDDDLLKTYGYRGFPSLAFLDAEGTKLLTQGNRTVKAFDESLTKVANFIELNAKVEAGDKTAVVPALLAQMSLGGIDYAGAQAKAKDATFSKEQKAAFTDALIPLLSTLPLDAAKIELKNLKLSDSQVAKADDVLLGMEIMAHLKGRRRDRGAAAKEAFYKMWKEGRSPKNFKNNSTMSFYDLLLRKAGEDSDAKLFAGAWKVMRAGMANNPRYARYVESMDAKLEKLQKESGDSGDEADKKDAEVSGPKK